ncbi:cytokinin dehydrogenase 6-like [Typha angustifolia]|uniref:cytokinin dehydrogenase 6-like n=1 Tax=Typha angustifolia TaxID=59011 RepID=UPI003C300300
MSNSLPSDVFPLGIATKILFDDNAITAVSSDFGGIIVGRRPLGVFCPSSEDDIVQLVRSAYESPKPFSITARGRGHSDSGQSVSTGGITIDMRSLAAGTQRIRIRVSSENGYSPYVDVGAEQLWSEVMLETLKNGLSPRTLLDYMDLTVGGTLSVGGLSGQAFRYGPQVQNVHELDVITGKGELVTCSKKHNSDLFFAALGGLGQFGIITRARIALQPAPTKVKWVGLVYTDFEAFAGDEEYLITLDGTTGKKKGFNYIEGFVFLDHNQVSSPFFSDEEVAKISAVTSEHGGAYFIEGAIYYSDDTAFTIDQEVESILEGLHYTKGFKFIRELSYTGFVDRVRCEEEKLRRFGLWDIPHPWLNLLVPKSRIHDFHEGVFKGVFKQGNTMGVILIYPLGKNKWDERMSLVFPEEEVFYKIGLLLSSFPVNLGCVLRQRDEVLRFCEKNKIEAKQYLPHYKKIEDWMKHFGSKWDRFVEMKKKYDPKAILAPGQCIFSSPLV